MPNQDLGAKLALARTLYHRLAYRACLNDHLAGKIPYAHIAPKADEALAEYDAILARGQGEDL